MSGTGLYYISTYMPNAIEGGPSVEKNREQHDGENPPCGLLFDSAASTRTPLFTVRTGTYKQPATAHLRASKPDLVDEEMFVMFSHAREPCKRPI